MSYCAIKSGLGFKKQEYRDSKTTHIIFDVDEYDELREDMESLRSRLVEEQQARKNDKYHAEQSAANERQEIVDKANAAIEKYKSHIEDLKAEIKSKEYLYANMKRIMRENANRDRKLQPKKQHNGYQVLQSRQADFAYMNGRQRENAKIWITTLQSFYDASIPIAQVRREIESDLKNFVLASLGFKMWSNGNPDGEYQVFTDDDGNEVNGLFRWRYNCNYKSGFWELTLYHTKSITVMQEMRAS